MLAIGRLQTIDDKGYRRIAGEIQTLEIDLKFWLVSRSSDAPENFPDYAIYAKSRSGRDIHIGGAWRKVMKAGRRAGEEFLSLTVDDPSFPAPLNVAAFQNGRPGEWDIIPASLRNDLFDPGLIAEGAEAAGLGHEPVPGEAAGIDDGPVIREHP